MLAQITSAEVDTNAMCTVFNNVATCTEYFPTSVNHAKYCCKADELQYDNAFHACKLRPMVCYLITTCTDAFTSSTLLANASLRRCHRVHNQEKAAEPQLAMSETLQLPPYCV